LDNVTGSVWVIDNEVGATLTLRRTKLLQCHYLIHNWGTVTAVDSDLHGGYSGDFALLNYAGASMTLRDTTIGGYNVLSNASTMTLVGVTMTSSFTNWGNHAPITNETGGVMAIEGSRFTDNDTRSSGTVSVLWNAGTATVKDSSFLRNQGGQAAIVNRGTITFTNVTFRDNVPADCVGCE
jgi:hypothetical protein